MMNVKVKSLKDPDELELAYYNKLVGFHTRVALPD